MYSPTDLGYAHRFVAGAGPAGHVTLLLLHGTGGDADSLLQLGATLYPDASLLSPAGKVIEANGVRRFFTRYSHDIFDLDDYRVRTDELAQFVRDATTAYALDEKRIVAVGYSNGANVAENIMFRHPGLLAGAVLFRALLIDEPDPIPDLGQTPVLLCTGEQDRMISQDAVAALQDVLQRANADLTVRVDPDGHELSMGDVMAARGWLAKYFSTKEPR